MKSLFDDSSFLCSKQITRTYSTSFSLGIKLLGPSIRPAIYAIYGFVRSADEIVDSFHEYEKEILFTEFKRDYQLALDRKISLNPILNAFQNIVHKYQLYKLVDAFLKSMEMDLIKKDYSTQEEYEEYIYGSADVVGLMCLKVFVKGDEEKYKSLKAPAMRLGSAFQKVNFLRDFKADSSDLGRSYFPNIQNSVFSSKIKEEIIKDITEDFEAAYKGIVQLPSEGKLGVYLAYRYYLCLLKKLKSKNSQQIMQSRARVSNPVKILILLKSLIRYRLNWI